MLEDRSAFRDAPTGSGGAPGVGTGAFWINERAEPTGALRLGLAGELDIASAGELRDRLEARWADGHALVLDLARLEFIDSSGMRELMRAVSSARRDGRSLVFDEAVRPQVRRVIELLGLTEMLWPPA